MLDKVDFRQKKLEKDDYKQEHDELVNRLVVLQELASRRGVGMVVLFEGWSGAGKGSRISDLLYHLDARATSVHVTEDFNRDDMNDLRMQNRWVSSYYPLMQPFWKALGPRGNMTFFDRGWYSRLSDFLRYDKPFTPVEEFLHEEEAQKEHRNRQIKAYHAVRSFEKQLVSDGYIVKKFFLHVSKNTMEERLRNLASDPYNAWRVDDEDLNELRDYERLYGIIDTFLDSTDFDFAPWIVLNAEDHRRVNLTVLRELVSAYEAVLNKGEDKAAKEAAAKAAANSAGQGEEKEWVDERKRTPEQQAAVEKENEAEAARQHKAAPKKSKYFHLLPDCPRIEDIPHDLHLENDLEYKKKLRKQQKRLNELETIMYQKRIPLIIMYEGSDAAGKGGNIKRIAQALDARAYTIYPSPAPTKPELMHPFLWRYWTRLPKAGHVGIYDRSWYGRVLVERVEGFASDKEWARAYDEINEFEHELIDWGAILVKFWVNTSREEQLARFEAREQNPDKQWKITAEDWRNRDKYPQYREAENDMFRLTNTNFAPWTVLESDDKHYARIKALKTVNAALEKRLLSE
ncbi:MAG: polyphosphate--AMP phosphotransferase [Eggerthellaceae bacterium]|jgi:polyphosphate kinase 2 (PPK2 family)